MSLFSRRPCQGCIERDKYATIREQAWTEASLAYQADIAYLRKQNESLTAKLAEMTSPGVTQRTEPRVRVVRPAPETFPVQKLPLPLPGHHV